MDTKQEKTEMPSVTYAAFEAMVTGYERHVRRLLVALLFAVVMLFLSNLAWLHFWSQFEFSDESYSDIYTQEGEGRFNINTGEQGDVNYGPSDLHAYIPQEDNDAP